MFSGEAEIQIRITDKNDNSPYFKHRLYNASVPENTDVGAVIITVTAEDEDEGKVSHDKYIFRIEPHEFGIHHGIKIGWG